jgi:hypothetical protein
MRRMDVKFKAWRSSDDIEMTELQHYGFTAFGLTCPPIA